ncbi:hypothetical protein M9435_002074 [Picochlorum sp. BPE23]|nr:hypothetical protein M9435_002074 [Picochlorum sp. BPE23]
MDDDFDFDLAEIDMLEQKALSERRIQTEHRANHNKENICSRECTVSGRDGVHPIVSKGVVGNQSSSGSLWGHLFQNGGLADTSNIVRGKSDDKCLEGHVKHVRGCDGTLQEKFQTAHHVHQSVQQAIGVVQPKNSWKPAHQPMWRPASGSLWEKPETNAPEAENVLNTGAISMALQENSSRAVDHCDRYLQENPVIPVRNACPAEDAQRETAQAQNMVEDNNGQSCRPWYETSDSDEEVELYEDWYYEKREVIPSDIEQNLMACSTTTGGLQVCRNAAQHWIYPSHIPERRYQLHAISRALLSNTLVCYPTGLGKTLIAAVVMHNFVRWFPKSKVVFIAPTKPLVSQQMKACQAFMGLHKSLTSEMTGKAKGEERRGSWVDPNVKAYFCTPQTFWNDVKRGICPYELVSCIVVDECHRATGQADVVQALKHMRQVKKSKFRVLGLSATPGSSQEQVQEVINSLGINTVVFKDETDRDVAPYVHKKESETHVVNPEYVGNACRSTLMASLQLIVGDLSGKGHYYGVADAERITRFGMQQARKSYKGGSWHVIQQFTQASILADVRDQLDGYGPKAALDFLQSKLRQEKSLKALYSKDPRFSNFVTSLEKAVQQGGPNPKIQKLKQILDSSFTSKNGQKIERAIIFATLRDGVAAITDALASMAPRVRAKSFIGQGGGSRKGAPGMKQKEQKQVLADFCSGECNVLVATCIGEEGLDIPNVDLIICFDAISSPTRALQRQGRTGRHGDGKVIYLVTAGQEEERFNTSAQAMKKLHAQLKEADRYFSLNTNVSRMLPREFTPKLAHIEIDDMHVTPGKASTRTVNTDENTPLAVQLEQIRKAMSSAGQDKTGKKDIRSAESVVNLISPASHGISGQKPETVSCSHTSPMVMGARKRNNYLLDSQSPQNNRESSPLSLEALSLVEKIGKSPMSACKVKPSKLGRLQRARDGLPEEEEKKPRRKKKKKVAGSPFHDGKKPKKFAAGLIDNEAEHSGSESDALSGDDDGMDQWDSDFINDGTPQGARPSSLPQWHLNKETQSPTPNKLMDLLRARKQGIAQGTQETFRNTPDEYDLHDSFIDDGSLDYESEEMIDRA